MSFIYMAADESGLHAAIGTNVENTDRSIAAADAVSPTNLQVTSATAALSNPTADNAAVRASLRMLRVHLRTFALGKMVEVVNSSAGLLTINRVEQTLQDLGINLKPKVPTKQVCLEHLELRKEIITLLNLQRQLQHKESEGSSYRDGPYSDMPGTPKDHAFVPEPVILGGERIGKKDHKRKGPGRIAEAPSSPALKRARKLKITD
ncbi:SWR1-complex protein 4-like protein [Drosera capensis]